MTKPYAVAAFYRFTPMADPAHLQASLLSALKERGAKGTVLLAPEGINGTLSMPHHEYDAVLSVLRGVPGCSDLEPKRSESEGHAFRRLKVRVKREIVALGIEGVDPMSSVGTYVAPSDWNALISDPETLVIDTRNAYEVQLGTFNGALDPCTQSFGDFPHWLEDIVAQHPPKRVAMFCTGGIRCEKATSFAKQVGIEDVYHLEGGILSYLESIPEAESLWQGECFVFDERVALTHGLETGEAVACRACKMPVGKAAQSHPHYQPGVSCPECFESTTPDQKARFAERQKQVELAEERGKAHLAGQ